MHILIAPDSFKGSISSVQAAKTIEKAIQSVSPGTVTRSFPMADGGEGTVDAIMTATGGERITKKVQDPLFRPVNADFGWIPDKKTAVIETAAASGLPLLKPEELAPHTCSTYGTGELIKEALDVGAETIILGLGGSATVDGGVGLFQALGLRVYDKSGEVIEYPGGNLKQIAGLDTSDLDKRLHDVTIIVASDVTNPLLGPNGAISVFGPQKGVTPELLERFEDGMRHFSTVVSNHTGRNEIQTPGSGAAGGIGYLLHSLLDVTFKPGLELVVEESRLEELLPSVDLIITGEGKVDGQSLFGKVPVGLGKLAKRHGIPLVAFAGTIGKGSEELEKYGVSVIHPLATGPMALEEAMINGEPLLYEAAVRLMKTLTLFN
ncbi:glycerate kinase [Bacillus sp. H-16]|uniref:glycerate kinase n=1 Tax=Alteribacter salitolerans TaxID=2912333 RepID=UPI00196497CC|nr:glycerate kinase [Alteribacter salitolerans]MBM7095490.1 glycerate kinase [Alteribacter salitolerans]